MDEMQFEFHAKIYGLPVPVEVRLTLSDSGGRAPRAVRCKAEVAGVAKIIDLPADVTEALGVLLIGIAKKARNPDTG